MYPARVCTGTRIRRIHIPNVEVADEGKKRENKQIKMINRFVCLCVRLNVELDDTQSECTIYL